MLDISSEDEDDISARNSQFIARQQQAPATMWLGTEDGTIHVYNCTDNIRIKKNKDKFCHPAPVLAILYLNNKVFAALATGQIFIYSRDLGGVWDKTGYETVRLGSAERPVTKMLVVGDALWCATGHQIKVLNPVTKEP